MSATITQEISKDLLSTLLSDDTFWPAEPNSVQETGLSEAFVESLVCKFLGRTGTSSGRKIADALCLPFGVIESLLATLHHHCRPGSSCCHNRISRSLREHCLKPRQNGFRAVVC